MKLEDIHEMWGEDSQIDTVNLSNESSNIAQLHNKYFKVYIEENLRLKKYRADYKQLKLLKEQYYKGELDSDELKEYGWKPQPLKILRQDIPTYVEGDQDIINLSLKIGIQEEKVGFLESIIKMITNRGFQLKTILDWERFKTGAI